MSLKKEVKKMRINWRKIDFISYDTTQMSNVSYIEYRRALDALDLAIVSGDQARVKYLEKRISEKRNYKFV